MANKIGQKKCILLDNKVGKNENFRWQIKWVNTSQKIKNGDASNI